MLLEHNSNYCQRCGSPVPQLINQPQLLTALPLQPSVKTNGMAIASLVLGIVGLVTFFWLGAIPLILSIIFGGIVLGQVKKNPDMKGKGMAVAGLVLGIVGLVLVILYVLLVVFGYWLTESGYGYTY
jgi:hypothetical protein